MEDETKPAEPKLILKDFAIQEQPKGPIQFDEGWTATIEKIGDELVEKLIVRMKEERFLILREPEPCPEGFVELETGGEPIVDFHVSIKAMEDAIKDDTTLEPLLRPGIEALQKPCEQTPDFVKDMYKMPSEPSNPFMQSNIDKKDYKFGGMGKIPRMTQEQREQLLPGDSDYYTTVRALQDDANIRESKIKADLSEFDKTDWQFFKEFVGREWRAVKVLWKRWRNK